MSRHSLRLLRASGGQLLNEAAHPLVALGPLLLDAGAPARALLLQHTTVLDPERVHLGLHDLPLAAGGGTRSVLRPR